MHVERAISQSPRRTPEYVPVTAPRHMRGNRVDKNAAGKRQRLFLFMAASLMLFCAVSAALFW
jgi:hypothetical protein